MAVLDDLNANLRIIEEMVYRSCELAPDVSLVRIIADMGEERVRTWVTLQDGTEHLVTEWGLSDEPPF